MACLGRKEARSPVIVTHPNDASLTIPAPNGLSRDPISSCQFIGTEHALGAQPGISIWETMMATELIDMRAVKGQSRKGAEALLVQLLSHPCIGILIKETIHG